MKSTRGNEEKYTFLEPGDLPKTKASILFAAISLGIFLLSLLATYLMDGKAPLVLGAVGLVGALCAAFAFVVGLMALARQEGRQRTCVIATLFSGIMTILWLTVFLNGVR